MSVGPRAQMMFRRIPDDRERSALQSAPSVMGDNAVIESPSDQAGCGGCAVRVVGADVVGALG